MAHNRPYSLPDLAPRQREILHAVIREHFLSARPVASATLVERYGLNVSGATIRNDLAALEELGLLTHPHTSAGRLPTDLGYRYFVESLMPQAELPAEERVTVSHQFRQARHEMAEWLRLAASTLVRITAEVAVATYDAAAAEEATWTRAIHYDGVERVLAQPEFTRPDAVREVMSLLTDRVLLDHVLPRSLGEGDIAVNIGAELGYEPLRDLCLVIGRYGIDRPLGYIGVVGPRRMDYQRTIGAVRYIGTLLGDLAIDAGGV
jgi:transcriptional regulator of heat shock response